MKRFIVCCMVLVGIGLLVSKGVQSMTAGLASYANPTSTLEASFEAATK